VICVNESARVGQEIRVHSASQLGEFVEVLVITSLHGPSRHCARDPRLRITARAAPAEEAEQRLAKLRERNFPKKFERVATVDSNDALPAGALLVATHTYRKVGPDEAAAWLVVNFSDASEKDERSYVADATAHCGSGALSIAWSTTFRQQDGAGEAVDSISHTPALKIDKPSAALLAGARKICSMERSP